MCFKSASCIVLRYLYYFYILSQSLYLVQLDLCSQFTYLSLLSVGLQSCGPVPTCFSSFCHHFCIWVFLNVTDSNLPFIYTHIPTHTSVNLHTYLLYTHTSIHLHICAHICTNICTCTAFKLSFRIVRCTLLFSKDIEVILLSRKSADPQIKRCKLLGCGLLCVHYSWLISCVSILWSSFLSGLACPPSTVSKFSVHALSWLHVSSPVTW